MEARQILAAAVGWLARGADYERALRGQLQPWELMLSCLAGAAACVVVLRPKIKPPAADKLSAA